MLKLLLGRVSNTVIALLAMLNFFLWQHNTFLRAKTKELLLKEQNTILSTQNSDQIHTIEIQRKVIEVVKNTESVDFDTNLKRMYNNEL